MAKIVLISCVSKKVSHPAKAKDLYISPLFKYNLHYAYLLKPEKIFILSAKHGLLSLDKKVTPYNTTLNLMSAVQIKKWAKNVLITLSKFTDLKKDEFIFLAGENYRRYLIPHIKHYSIPMKGLRIGQQLSFLKKIVNE